MPYHLTLMWRSIASVPLLFLIIICRFIGRKQCQSLILVKHCLAPDPFSGQKKQQTKDRENVRSMTVQILEIMYDLVFEHKQTHFDDSTANKFSIDCPEITLQSDGSQSSPFFKSWTLRGLHKYLLDYSMSITSDWTERDKRWFDDRFGNYQKHPKQGVGVLGRIILCHYSLYARTTT